MNSRYLLLLFFCMMTAGVVAQNGKQKKLAKTAKGISKKKPITEAEAKKLHEDQLAKEGKANERRAYKRSDFEIQPSSDDWAVDAAVQEHREPRSAAKPQAAPLPTPANTAKAAPATPKFIEGIVLERKEG